VLEVLEAPRRVRSEPEQERFRELLLAWRRGSQAWSPPWRGGEGPWLVLAAELLLSRARPADAEQIFGKLKQLAPDPAALLAHPNPERVLTEIGVKDRAPLLVALANDLVTYFDGSVPEDEMSLSLLPGVGDYACRATLTFGFGRRQVLVDRTTARVISRLTGHDDSRRFQRRLDLHRLAGSRGPDAEFNRALLDLGRELCRPEAPRCGRCPLRSRCATGRTAVVQLELGDKPDQTQEPVAA
jgi:A/G-specific adenine glycosylase